MSPARPGRWDTVIRLGAVACVLLGVAAVFQARHLKTDNAIERWLDPDSPATQDYDRFLQTFGEDEFVVVAVSGKPLFDPAALDAMLAALHNLESVPHIHRVTGIPSVYRDLFGAEDPEALKEEFTSTPFYEGLFISRDHQVAGLFLEMDPPMDAAGRRTLMRNVEEAAVPLAAYGFRLDFVGPPALNVVLDRVSERETLRAMPVALLCSLVVLVLLLRSWRATLIAASCGAISVVLPMGLIAMMDRPLTMVSAILPPLFWVLSLSHSVHIITRYQHHRAAAPSLAEAMARAFHNTILPCTLSAVTTSAGFLSLTFSTMPPIREMGAFAALGLVAALLVNLTVVPTLLPLLRVPPRRSARSAWLPILHRAEGAAQRHPWLAVAAFCVVMAAGLFSLGRIPPEPNPLNFLPEDSPAVQSYNFVSDRLTGLYSLEVVLECPGGWLDPQYWPAVEALAADTEQSPSVARVITALDMLKKLNQWDNDLDPAAYRMPPSKEKAESLLGNLNAVGQEELHRLVSHDGKRLRLSILPTVMDAKRFYQLTDAVERKLASMPSGMSGHLTGIVYLLNNAQVDLAVTQIRSFAFAFVVVFLIIAVGLRSIRLMLLSVPPNLTPILAVFALMPLLRIPLDAATVLVAGVALGISVDNTVHLLTAFRRARLDAPTAKEAVGTVLNEVGPAMIYSTLTSCIGFFTLVTSGFVPIRYFGLLSGIALIVALAADLVLTPSILVLVNGRGFRRAETTTASKQLTTTP